MHVGHFAVGEPHVLLLPTRLYYSVWWAGRSAGLVCVESGYSSYSLYESEVCLLGSGPSLRCL